MTVNNSPHELPLPPALDPRRIGSNRVSAAELADFPFDGVSGARDGREMVESNEFDLVVIGGGPAGYAGAIRAGQLGRKVACIESERAGGTCLNWGCIPTKSLLKNAEVYQTIKHHAADFGLKVEGLSYEWDKVIGRSRKVADRLAGGIEMLIGARGIAIPCIVGGVDEPRRTRTGCRQRRENNFVAYQRPIGWEGINSDCPGSLAA